METYLWEYGSWLFGWKEIGALLRLLRNHWFSYKLYAKRLFLIGLGAGAPRIVLLSLSFFLLVELPHKFFLLIVCCFFLFFGSPSWTPCICFLCFFILINIILITYQKKKKETLGFELITQWYRHFLWCLMFGLTTWIAKNEKTNYETLWNKNFEYRLKHERTIMGNQFGFMPRWSTMRAIFLLKCFFFFFLISKKFIDIKKRGTP